MVVLLGSLGSATAAINHLKTLDEYLSLRVSEVTLCTKPDYLPLRIREAESTRKIYKRCDLFLA